MKLLSYATIATSFLATAFAATIEIGYPTPGTVFHPNQKVTAEILRPDSIMGCQEVGIALAIATCTQGGCPQPQAKLGSVLYSGSFNPTLHQHQYYQNFTFNIPSYIENGAAIFTLTHLCLIGAGPFPLLEFRNVSVSIAPKK